MELDTGKQAGVQQPEKTNNTTTMPSTLQLKQREHPNDRRKYEGIGSNTMAKTERWKFKTDWVREQIFIRYRKEICIERNTVTSCCMENGTPTESQLNY